ncbi:MAG: hypothetical protein KGI28_04340 [Thaumarchaeota archaeon]|nr:hypothetical protein [Nitrososphaerota archaeon]
MGTGLRGLATIGIADIASNGIAAIFWFYMASLLGVDAYGKVSYFLAIGSIASTVSLVGASNMLSVYTAKNIKIEAPVFFISIVAGCISSLVLYFIFHDIGTSIYAFGAVIFGLASFEVLGKKMYNSYTKYVITNKVLMVGLSIGFYYLSGWEGVILGIGLAFFPYSIRIYKGFKETNLDFSLIKPRFGFMINSFVLNLAGAINGSIDKIIIAPILGYTVLGNYQLGLQFFSILQILPSIAYKYMLPHDASGNPNKKLKMIIFLMSIGFAVIGIFFSPILIPIIFPKFIQATEVIQIISLGTIPSSTILIYQSKFLGAEKSRFILTGSLIYIIMEVVLILALGTNFGIRGVATALVLAGTSEAIFYVIINRIFKETKTLG